MKKFTLLLISALTISSTISAEEKKSFNKIINSESYTLKCMVSLKCKDEVKQIHNISDISKSFPDSNFDVISDEFNRMLSSLQKIKVKVFLGNEKYFPSNYRGLYSTKKNNIYLNEAYMSNPVNLITTMRHEGWHVAQDCRAGIRNTKMNIIISEKYVPKSYQDEVEEIYASEPNYIPYEKEAYWASNVLGMTEVALESCVENLKYHIE